MNSLPKPDCYDITQALLPHYEYQSERGWVDTRRVPVCVTSSVVLDALTSLMDKRGWSKRVYAYAVKNHRERVDRTLESHWAPMALELYCDTIREMGLLDEPVAATPVEVLSEELQHFS